MKNLCTYFILLSAATCRPANNTNYPSQPIEFSQPEKVKMTGYSGNIMEPFLSRDGSTLLFNNRNDASENTNIHWAGRINDNIFQYKGEVTGLNTAALEGVPTLDNFGNLYFVSDRSYAKTLSTLYQCNYSNGAAKNVQLVKGISKLQAGDVNFDVEVSADGQYLYFVDVQFDAQGTPRTADLVIAKKTGASFQRLSNSDELMQNVNTDALEYGACISANQLDLYFTRVQLPFTATTAPEIFAAQRRHIGEAFNIPQKIKNITGFAEAPTIAPDQKTIYYHKKEHNKFVLYMTRKK